MSSHRLLVVCSSAIAVLLGAAVPAVAGSPSPAGCTFAKGQTTCVTTTYASRLSEPVTATGPADGSLPAQWCLLNFGPEYVYYGTSQAVFSVIVTTTTTTVRRGGTGGNGPVLSRTSTEAVGEPSHVSGLLDCSTGPF
ncbi:hypothetical protein DQ237_10340 [Blastococcus sp. TF02-8]|uniref:hypothetical protein n=1 Tax=Blastococcus sp. TF02-8 TaxID=2250574 RepID=UPI000DEBCB27|nr:hypothetical protein [Blastococcus sp. TF02-8]RBY96251.1 hypothetical protein DQ237_10340 [Blastococcus sp. TF02-8]